MSNGKEFILSTNHLSKEFYENGRTLVACHDINIQVEKGKTLAIVGESGCYVYGACCGISSGG